MEYHWGTKEWFEDQFKNAEECGYDGWGHQWRGSQKFRYASNIKFLRHLLPTKEKINILDIGCGLGDFTNKVSILDPKNKILGIDISKNAISLASKKFPSISFKVAALPELPIDENSFDLVLCLEILYYLKEQDRKKAIENIKNLITPNGYLFLSGPIDGGNRYFDEKNIINVISEFFIIVNTDYHYTTIYTAIERLFLYILNRFNIAELCLNMSHENFLKWCERQLNKQNTEKVKHYRKLVNKIPSSHDIIKIINKVINPMIRGILSAELPVVVFSKLTKLRYGERGKRRILILARSGKNR